MRVIAKIIIPFALLAFGRAAPARAQAGVVVVVNAQNPVAALSRRASTGAVSGRTSRHLKNASAACSTSMPRPSDTMAAPCARANFMKGVSRPYIMS